MKRNVLLEKKLTEPDWVCEDCAHKRGARMPSGHFATFHMGVCGICKKERHVTEPRDFGKTRNLLLI